MAAQALVEYAPLVYALTGTGALAGVSTFVMRTPLWARMQARRFVRKPVQPFALQPNNRVLYPNLRLDESLATALVHSTSGVWLLHTEAGSGKSTATRHVLRRLQEKKLIAGACVVDCKDIVQIMSQEKITSPSLALRYQMYNEMNISRKNRLSHQLSVLFRPARAGGRRVVVVMDHFELLRKAATENELHLMVKGMALDAVQANVHTVLINIADKEFAETMESWNNKEKIVSIPSLEDFKWTREELAKVMEQYRAHDAHLKDMTDAQASAILNKCATVGGIAVARDRYVEKLHRVNLKD